MYRLEFNENQQCYHHDWANGTDKPETFGWFTIFENCTNLEIKFFEAYVNRIPKQKLSKEYLLKCASEAKFMFDFLLENNITFTYY